MWVPASQTANDGKTATVEVPQYPDEASIACDAGVGRKTKTVKVKLADYAGGGLPMQNVDGAGNLIEFADMVDMKYLHEPGILMNLKKRHVNMMPYTRTGDIILALNPFKRYKQLYDEKNRNLYSNMIVWKANGEEDPRKKLDPHVYETSSFCFRGLSFEKQHQSILVSGESGAGKTETVKICMNHMAVVQRGPVAGETGEEQQDPVVNRILTSNPLLEAFGNAKTTRNDNSSRFGKYLQLQFHDTDPNAMTPNLKETTCILAGSKSDTYLLEKNRITGHDASERSYHVFYYVVAASDEEKAKVWDVMVGKSEEDFKYTGKSPPNTLIDGMTDQDHYLDTQATLQLINIDGDDLKGLWQAIAGVIACGNITFAADPKDEEKSICSSPKELKEVADLFGISVEQLTLSFTERTLKTRNDSYKVPQLEGKAKETCDAFAKEIYAKLFDWVVSRINAATSAELQYHMKDTVEYGIIGLLDIFGFESFKINRFEQLCINYANEKLQQKFTEDVFETVQREYEEEGIDLDEVSYDDNSDVLALVESKQGIMDNLNEACVRPKGDDASFVNGALAANKKNPALIINKMDRMQFGVHHFAGKVMYSGYQFVERNKDALPLDLEEAMNASSNFLVCLKKDAGAAAPTKKPKRSKSVVGQTVWNKYKVQLASLMGNLRKTKSRYIRCVKPNKAKVPEVVEHVSTVEQLRSAGVVAALTITRSAFPNRVDNGPGIKKFELFWDKEKSPLKLNGGEDEAQTLAAKSNAVFTSALLAREKDGKQDFVVGKTRTYFREGGLEYLEMKRAEALGDVATEVSRLCRGYIGRKNILKIFFAKQEAERVAREAKEEAEREEREKREAAEAAAKFEAEREEREAREEAEREEREAREEAEREEREAQEARDAIEREKQAKKEKLLAIKREKEEKKKKEEEAKEALRQLEKQKKEMEKQAKLIAEQQKEAEREVKKLEKQLEEELETVAKLQAKYDGLQAQAAALPVKDIEKLQKKADDSDKLVKYLKKENTRMRNETRQMEEDLTKMKETNNRLIEANASAGASLDTLNKQAKILKDHNKKLDNSIDEFKAANKKLDHDLEGRKAYFKAETKIRGDYETVMEKIVKSMEDKCDDSELVEKIMTAQLTCVTNIAKGH